MSQQHLLLDFCPQPLQNRAMGRPIIQVESHNMRTDRTDYVVEHIDIWEKICNGVPARTLYDIVRYNSICLTFQRFPFRARQRSKVKRFWDGRKNQNNPSQHFLTLPICLALKGKR